MREIERQDNCVIHFWDQRPPTPEDTFRVIDALLSYVASVQPFVSKVIEEGGCTIEQHWYLWGDYHPVEKHVVDCLGMDELPEKIQEAREVLDKLVDPVEPRAKP